MPQFFVKPEHLRQEHVTLHGPDARHIINVLRLKSGDWIVLCDGEGHRYESSIKSIKPLCVELTVGRELPQPAMPVEITLGASVIRPELFEWLIEKAFELGCRRLTPMTTERTVAKYLPKKPAHSLERWRNIAISAAKQSGLPWMPEVTPITALTDVLQGAGTAIQYCWEGLVHGEGKGFVCEQANDQRVPASSKLCGGPATQCGGEGVVAGPTRARLRCSGGTNDVFILIGPEGGFSPAEHEAVMATNPTLLPLGPLILRTETAAITAITLAQQSAGYFQLR